MVIVLDPSRQSLQTIREDTTSWPAHRRRRPVKPRPGGQGCLSKWKPGI